MSSMKPEVDAEFFEFAHTMCLKFPAQIQDLMLAVYVSANHRYIEHLHQTWHITFTIYACQEHLICISKRSQNTFRVLLR